MIVNLVMLIQVISALVIVGLVLMQHGKGADMGAAFGSGASGSLFGASGSSNFLSKSTGIAAAIFFTSTLGLAYLNSGPHVSNNALDAVVPATVPAPAASAPAASVPAASAPAASAPVAPAIRIPAASAPAASAPAAVPAASAPAASAPAKTAPAASQSAPAQK